MTTRDSEGREAGSGRTCQGLSLFAQDRELGEARKGSLTSHPRPGTSGAAHLAQVYLQPPYPQPEWTLAQVYLLLTAASPPPAVTLSSKPVPEAALGSTGTRGLQDSLLVSPGGPGAPT